MGVFSKPKAPAKTAEQTAGEQRTRSLLDKEIGESESLFKLLKSKTLGRSSLLTGAPRNIGEAAVTPVSRTNKGVGIIKPRGTTSAGRAVSRVAASLLNSRTNAGNR